MKNEHQYIVLIDIDDTIEDLLGAWCKWLNNHHGTNVKPEEITEWDITKFFPNLSKDEIFAPLNKDDFWRTVKPKHGAIKHIKRLIDDGFKVFLCTSSSYASIKPKFEYVIKRYFPFIKWNDIIIASNKSMIEGDFIIDDGLHNLCHPNSKRLCSILMTAPHNKDFNVAQTHITRVNSWAEAYKTIKRY